MKWQSFLLSLLILVSGTGTGTCKCYTEKKIPAYVREHIYCTKKDYIGYQVIDVLPGTFYMCNTSCPPWECVNNTYLWVWRGNYQNRLFFGDCYKPEYDDFCL